MSKNSANRTPAQQNVTVLKSRIKDLEGEVSTLKSRLDDLRKAKNNTVLKREREIIHVGEPTLGRPVGVETSKYRELEKKLSDAESKLKAVQKQNDELKANAETGGSAKSIAEKDRDNWKQKYESLEADVNALQMNHEIELGELRGLMREKSAQLDDVTTELLRLRERLEMKAMQEEHKGRENTDREGHIKTITEDNALLREKIENLYIELSVKEAQWMEKEDKLKEAIKKDWGERYSAWMAATEKKLKELQEANEMLKSCLHKGERKHKGNLKGFEEEEESENGGSSSKT